MIKPCGFFKKTHGICLAAASLPVSSAMMLLLGAGFGSAPPPTNPTKPKPKPNQMDQMPLVNAILFQVVKSSPSPSGQHKPFPGSSPPPFPITGMQIMVDQGPQTQTQIQKSRYNRQDFHPDALKSFSIHNVHRIGRLWYFESHISGLWVAEQIE